MNLIRNISDAPLQKQKLILPDGTSLTLVLNYIPMQYGWFIQSLTYKTFTLNGFRLCTSPNILQQYANQLPFGIACFTQDNAEPHHVQDFKSGYASLYLLTSDEVIQLQEIISG